MLKILRIVVRAGQQWSDNQDARQGAALAYYALFSIAPLLVISVSIAGAVFGDEAARGEVEHHLAEFMDPDTAKAIQALVDNASKSQRGLTFASVASLVVLVFGALGAFLQLRSALATIWKFDPPHKNSYLALLIDYALALLMVLFTGILLLGSLVVSIVVRAVRAYMEEYVPSDVFPWDTSIELLSSFLFLTALVTMIYRIMSGRRIGWGYVMYGAIIASVLFTAGKTLLSLYLVHSGTASAYGAAGSIVVFLMWVYYSSQILFFCAELIQARRTRHEWLAPKAAAGAD